MGRNEIIVDEKLAEGRYIELLIRGIVSTQKSARGMSSGKKKTIIPIFTWRKNISMEISQVTITLEQCSGVLDNIDIWINNEIFRFVSNIRNCPKSLAKL